MQKIASIFGPRKLIFLQSKIFAIFFIFWKRNCVFISLTHVQEELCNVYTISIFASIGNLINVARKLITRGVYFSRRRHFCDIKFWRILDVDIVIFITSNASKIDSCQNFGCRQIETIQNQGIASPRSLDKNTFPLAETVFPLAETVFPLAEIVFPLAETVFPLAETVFPLAEIVFPLRETVFFILIFRTCLLGARKKSSFWNMFARGPKNVWSRCVHFTSQILWKKYKFCDDWILGTRVEKNKRPEPPHPH